MTATGVVYAAGTTLASLPQAMLFANVSRAVGAPPRDSRRRVRRRTCAPLLANPEGRTRPDCREPHANRLGLRADPSALVRALRPPLAGLDHADGREWGDCRRGRRDAGRGRHREPDAAE